MRCSTWRSWRTAWAGGGWTCRGSTPRRGGSGWGCVRKRFRCWRWGCSSMVDGETCQVQTAPGALLHPWKEQGRELSPTEARCLVDALEPVDWQKLLREYGRELLAGLVQRGVLVRAPARPRLWTRYGWARAEAFVAAVTRARARHAHQGRPTPGPVAGVLSEPGAVRASLRRRSVGAFGGVPLPCEVLDAVLAPAVPLLEQMPHLRLYVAA